MTRIFVLFLTGSIIISGLSACGGGSGATDTSTGGGSGEGRHSLQSLRSQSGEAIGGGVTVWADGQELATVKLPIAGLMSDSPAAEVAAAADQMVAAMAACGCKLNNAYMQHSLLALVVIPSLRISDMGLIDVTTFTKVDLFTETQ